MVVDFLFIVAYLSSFDIIDFDGYIWYSSIKVFNGRRSVQKELYEGSHW
jgi:hypothetical protein